jgi:DNA-binding NtrC family response regulator
MTFIRDDERDLVGAVAGLVDCNPFLPGRLDLERRALGQDYVQSAPVWHAAGATAPRSENAIRLAPVVEQLGTALQQRLAAGASATADQLADYHRIVLYVLFQRYESDWLALIKPAEPTADLPKRVSCYRRFAEDVAYFFGPVSGFRTESVDPALLFALGFQARRAFQQVFRTIFGGSLPAAQLRAAVWQSIFTHNVRRYREQIYDRMADIPTLITGESGTGKELVARAIALARYVPFDPRTETFADDPAVGFHAVNLSALSPTLIETELFGHRRGAFTGATDDRVGWLETCRPYGAVFLDEIGELDAGIQVKLLRVLQTRELQRIGETEVRRFTGKVIAATNRHLEADIARGRFREDFYYRICADRIRTPSLREQLDATPGDRRNLLRIVAGRVVGAAGADDLAAEAERWVEHHLPPDYAWPGNMRELEQCVRSILIRGVYEPRAALAGVSPADAEVMGDGTLTADQMLQCYCAKVYADTSSFEETARRLKLDRRTVRAKARAWARRGTPDS